MVILKVVFIYVIFVPSFYLFAEELSDSENFFPVSQNQTPASSSQSDYKCQIDQQCLDTLKNELLNTESDKSLYSFCKSSYRDSQACCHNPSQCNAPFGKDVAQTLREKSLKNGEATLNCSSNTTKNLLNIYNTVCDKSKEFCKNNCERKLKEFKGFFRTCFSIPDSYTIDEALKKASNSSQGLCYQEMRYVVEKYKEQSLSKTALFQENIKAGDMVNCEKIEDSRSEANFRSFERGMCEKATAEVKREKHMYSSPRVLKEQRKAKKLKNQKLLTNNEATETKTNRQADMDTELQKSLPSLHARADGDTELQKSLPKPNCPVSIKSAVVFQSVEAPQLKPMGKQEKQTDPEHPSFKNYDLVANKPAGILVTLEKSKHFQEEKDFKVSLDIENKLIKKTSHYNYCFHDPFRNNSWQSEGDSSTMWMRDKNQTECSVNSSQFVKEKSYKFFGFPNHNDNKNDNFNFLKLIRNTERTVSARVKLSSASFSQCNQEVKFDMKIKKIEPLKLGFTGIKMDKCGKFIKKYQPLSDPIKKVKDFINSEEISHYLQAMFPIPNLESSFLKNNEKEKVVDGTCNGTRAYVKDVPDSEVREILTDVLHREAVENIKELRDEIRKAFEEDLKNPNISGIIRKNVKKEYEEYQNHEKLDKKFIDFLIRKTQGTPGNQKYRYLKRALEKSGITPLSISKGILRDLLDLEITRKDSTQKYHKLVSIVSKNYFNFHLKKTSIGGLVFYFASSNIVIVSEEIAYRTSSGSLKTINTINKGVIAHELGHTLLQVREHYRKNDGKNFLPDEKQEHCKRFNGSQEDVCYTYVISRVLDTELLNGIQKWRFAKNKFSIMNNIGLTKGLDIPNQWIDRETYQKTFDTLSQRKGGVLGLEKKEDREILKKVFLSGFYNNFTNKVVVPKTEIKNTSAITPFVPKNNKFPLLTFQLREGKQVLQTIKQPFFDTEIKFIERDGTEKRVSFPASPFLVYLKLPSGYENKDLSIHVLNPLDSNDRKGIYSAPVPKKHGSVL